MKRVTALTIGLGLALSACQDTAGPEGDRLTRAEALRVVAGLVETSESAAEATMANPGAESGIVLAGPPVSFTHTHHSSHPCPSGGTLAIDFEIDGMFDDSAHSFQADLAGSHTHNDCAFPHGNITITVDGDPNISFAASVGAQNALPSQPFTHSLEGAFHWETSDGRAGHCTVSLDAVTDFVAKQRHVEASICGHTIDQTTTWN